MSIEFDVPLVGQAWSIDVVGARICLGWGISPTTHTKSAESAEYGATIMSNESALTPGRTSTFQSAGTSLQGAVEQEPNGRSRTCPVQFVPPAGSPTGRINGSSANGV